MHRQLWRFFQWSFARKFDGWLDNSVEIDCTLRIRSIMKWASGSICNVCLCVLTSKLSYLLRLSTFFLCVCKSSLVVWHILIYCCFSCAICLMIWWESVGCTWFWRHQLLFFCRIVVSTNSKCEFKHSVKCIWVTTAFNGGQCESRIHSETKREVC